MIAEVFSREGIISKAVHLEMLPEIGNTVTVQGSGSTRRYEVIQIDWYIDKYQYADKRAQIRIEVSEIV